jgi:hypothetical protein
MAKFKSLDQIEGGPAAEARARAVLRQALGHAPGGTVRDVFDLAVTRELAHMPYRQPRRR